MVKEINSAFKVRKISRTHSHAMKILQKLLLLSWNVSSSAQTNFQINWMELYRWTDVLLIVCGVALIGEEEIGSGDREFLRLPFALSKFQRNLNLGKFVEFWSTIVLRFKLSNGRRSGVVWILWRSFVDDSAVGFDDDDECN